MESKSAMEVFVANPTAGSCGTVGGVVKAIAEELKSTQDELIKAYFAAGMVGVYFASDPDFLLKNMDARLSVALPVEWLLLPLCNCLEDRLVIALMQPPWLFKI